MKSFVFKMNGYEIDLDFVRQCSDEFTDLSELILTGKTEVEGWSSEDSVDTITLEEVDKQKNISIKKGL